MTFSPGGIETNMTFRCLLGCAVAAFVLSTTGVQTQSGAAMGPIPVQLVADRSVLGRSTPVSFGLPLPAGALQDTSRVVVRNAAGAEIAAHVSSLGTWRTLPPAILNCGGSPAAPAPGSQRSVLIQFDQVFTSVEPLTVSIELGVPRTLNVAAPRPALESWKNVDSGSYGQAAQLPFATNVTVREPSVYALLPPAWLACSGLATITAPVGVSTRLQAFDRGHQDFFETVINEFNPKPAAAGLVNFYADDEPWLYDRAQVFYTLYVRTGGLKALREAHRASSHYLINLYVSGGCPSDVPGEWCRGFFKLKNPADLYYKDSKYSYNESLATRYWLTGDPSLRQRLADVTAATRQEVTPEQPQDPNTFTERHTANALLAPVMEYEVTGDASLASYAGAIVTTLEGMQRVPMGGRPMNGCFNHYHEGIETVSFSPWMSSLLAHALLRTYMTFGDPRIPAMITGLAQCVADRAAYDTTEIDPGRRLTVARYIASSYGAFAELDSQDGSPDPWRDMEHAVDVAYVTALGAFFTGDPVVKSRLTAMTHQLLETHAFVLGYWTRLDAWPGNGLARYRVAPPRKFGWWYKNSGAIGWALAGPPRSMPAGAPRAPTGFRVVSP